MYNNLDRNNVEINRGDLCRFVGDFSKITGAQVLHKCALKYIGKMCRVIDVCNGEGWCRVAFTRENGTKYYTIRGKKFLEVDKRETRKNKLKKLNG